MCFFKGQQKEDLTWARRAGLTCWYWPISRQRSSHILSPIEISCKLLRWERDDKVYILLHQSISFLDRHLKFSMKSKKMYSKQYWTDSVDSNVYKSRYDDAKSMHLIDIICYWLRLHYHSELWVIYSSRWMTASSWLVTDTIIQVTWKTFQFILAVSVVYKG